MKSITCENDFKRLFCSVKICVLQVDFVACIAALDLIVIVADMPQNVVVAETVFLAVDEVEISHTTIIAKIQEIVKRDKSNKINNLHTPCKTSCSPIAAVLFWGLN